MVHWRLAGAVRRPASLMQQPSIKSCKLRNDKGAHSADVRTEFYHIELLSNQVKTMPTRMYVVILFDAMKSWFDFMLPWLGLGPVFFSLEQPLRSGATMGNLRDMLLLINVLKQVFISILTIDLEGVLYVQCTMIRGRDLRLDVCGALYLSSS